MAEPTPRQVLYALVAGGFHLVVGVLIAGAALAGLTDSRTTWLWGAVWMIGLAWGIGRWRRTGPILVASIGLFVVWVAVTLVTT